MITHGIEGLSSFGLFGSGFGGTVVSAYLDWIQTILSGDLIASQGESFAGESHASVAQQPLTELISDDLALLVLINTMTSDDDSPLMVPYRTADCTAIPSDDDYVADTGALTFAPGEMTITVEVKADTKKEGNEYFYIDLFGNSGNSLITKSRGMARS